MFTHAGYLRLLMLICSIMTMTGVHKPDDHLSVGWRVCQLLSLSGMSLLLLSILAEVWVSFSYGFQYTLHCLSWSLGALLFLVLLFWCCRHRRALHRMVQLLANLEGEHKPRWRDILNLRLLSALLAVMISSGLAILVSSSLTYFRHYITPIPMYIPVTMETSDWYPVLCTFQIVLLVIGFVCIYELTLILTGLVDGAALELRRILHALRNCFPDTEDDPPATGAGVKTTKVAASAGAVPATSGGHSGCGEGVLPAEDDVEESAVSAPGPDVSLQLSRLSDRYRLVFRLTSDVAKTFSVAVLSLYAITTAILLIGGYCVVKTTTLGYPVQWLVAWYFFMALLFICLCGISISGSSLIQQSNQIHEVIDKDLCPRPMSPATRQQLQLLMDQTSTPLAIGIWGLFSLQKTSVLSVMSFVLNYFIIMLQMINWYGK